MRLRRWAVWAGVSGAGLACALTARPARAWTEAHQSSSEVKVQVDAAGVARFEHDIGYRILRGPLRSFEIVGVEKNAVVTPEASITAPDGRELTAHVEAVPEKKLLRVAVDEPRALMRGTFVFHVKYAVDLVASQELSKDGPMWRLAWTAPVASDGVDDGKVIFEVPAAPTPPTAIDALTGGGDDSVLSSLKRAPDRDSLEVLRPHVARGEASVWAVRLDPRAFADVKAPELRPAPPPPPPKPDATRELGAVAALALLAGLFALLVRQKERGFARRASKDVRGPLGLVPISAGWRGLFAASALTGGVALQLQAQLTAAAALVAVAIVFASIRAPAARLPARGPGKWLPIRPEEAFAKRPAAGGWLDIGCAAGKVSAAVVIAALGGLAIAARRLAPEAPYLVALDALVLVPIFWTGRAAQLTPDLAREPAAWLVSVWARLKKNGGLRAVPWARVPTGCTEPDELRLLVVPRAPIAGLVGVEVGLAWGRTFGGWGASPEVLVRVQEGSLAAGRIALLAPFARPVPGRRADERVIRLVPAFGTRAGVLALVERLARELTDRRVRVVSLAEAGYDGEDRRNAA